MPVRGGQNVACKIDGGRGRKCVAVSPADPGGSWRVRRQVSENPLARGVRENGGNEIALGQKSLAVIQEEEERFVFDDWAAEPSAELIAVLI